MAIRDKLRANATPYLQPGESIQAVFCGQTTSQWFALISWWIIVAKNSYRVVVVTDRRILVCRSGRLTMTPVKAVLAEYSRSTRIGPASGLWYKCETLGERMYVHKRFHKDIAAADGMAPAPGAAASASTAGRWAPDPSGRYEMRYWDGSTWTNHVQSGGVQTTDAV